MFFFIFLLDSPALNVRSKKLSLRAFLDKMLVLTTGLAHFSRMEKYLQIRLDQTPSMTGPGRRRGHPRKDATPYSPGPSRELLQTELRTTRVMIQQRAKGLNDVVGSHVSSNMLSDSGGCVHIGPDSSVCLG